MGVAIVAIIAVNEKWSKWNKLLTHSCDKEIVEKLEIWRVPLARSPISHFSPFPGRGIKGDQGASTFRRPWMLSSGFRWHRVK
jgi:hypothetical protein